MIYLNYCGISPLCSPALQAQQRLAEAQHRLGAGMFREFPDVLDVFRRAVGRLLHCSASDITYTDNTAFGINLVANGYPFQSGDEVISYVNEYPANHYPWVLQRKRGVEVRFVHDANAGGAYPDPSLPRGISMNDIAALVTPRTRVIALSHVQFVSGFALDLTELGSFCSARGIDLVVDAAQSLGSIPLDLQASPIAALAASGWKWLCGPIGSGILYTSPALRAKMAVTMTGAEMMEQGEAYLNHAWQPFRDSRLFEYSTLPLMEAAGLAAAVEAAAETGVEGIYQQLMVLRDLFLSLVDHSLIRPVELEQRHRSGIVSFVTDRDPIAVAAVLRKKGVFMTSRGGYLRFAPYYRTTHEEVYSAVKLLNEVLRE